LLLAGLWLFVSAMAAPVPARAEDALVQGTVNYEKVPATLQGLRYNASQLRPVAGVTVSVIPSNSPTTPLGRGVTDENGFFQITVSLASPTTVYLQVRAEADNASVVNNATGALYAYRFSDFLLSPGQTVTRTSSLVDNGRSAAPFNILANIRAANKVIRALAPGIVLPPVTINWASNYSGGAYFSAPRSIFLNGDRDVNSDEYDDGAILHEYGHFVAYNFSRDDSPTGTHLLGNGEQLDPRLAYSEGWANFFAQAILNDPNWVRTLGPNGSMGWGYSLEPNVFPWDQPSYASEWTVGGVLWDLFDTSADEGDTLALGLGPLWKALTGGMRDERDVYLIDFCDVLVRDYAGRTTDILPGIASILKAHQITYTPGAVPSVPDPFPIALTARTTVTGSLDSTVPDDRPNRWNLRSAKAIYTFTLPSPAAVDLLLSITSSSKPATSDLDLYLLNARDELVGMSDTTNGVGGTERIRSNLPAGVYRVEVWSAYRDTTWHYNTAAFQLTATY
jgi:hypothetical protein